MAEQQEAPPHCFGNKWDANHPECKGGYDPAHKDDETGSHIRGKCMWFEPCGAKQQAARMEPARQLLDPRSLVKNNIPTLGPARSTPPQQTQTAQFVERFAQSVAQQSQQMVPYQPPAMMKAPPQAPPQQQMMYIQPPHPQQMPYGYQQMMPVNYQMPGYLTVPEVRHPEQSFFGFAMRTVFRSMGKSMGHSIAHLFDTVPLTPPGPHHGGSGSSGGG